MDNSNQQTIRVCIQRLCIYATRCDAKTASTIRKIMKILSKYITAKHNRGVNPINQTHLNVLDRYIMKIQNDVPADIIFLVNDAAEIIRDDQSNHHMIDQHVMGQHMIGQHVMGQHMMGQHVRDINDAISQHMMGQHMMGQHMMEHNIDDCEKYAKLLKEINRIQFQEFDPDDMDIIHNERRYTIIVNIISEIETKYTNLRRESNIIRNRLNELELEPNENAKHIYNLVARLAIITDQTSKFEKRNGGGASKF